MGEMGEQLLRRMNKGLRAPGGWARGYPTKNHPFYFTQSKPEVSEGQELIQSITETTGNSYCILNSLGFLFSTLNYPRTGVGVSSTV